MRNNIRGLIFHIFLGLILFVLAYFINLSPSLTGVLYGNFIFRLVLIAFIIFLYFNFSKAMSKRQNKNFDFLAGNLIVFIGLITIGFAFLGLGKNIFEAGPGGSGFRIFMDVFLFPQLYIIRLLKLKESFVSLILLSFLPGLIYGISIKISRKKLIRKRNLSRKKRYE
jgi:hypothetical protein